MTEIIVGLVALILLLLMTAPLETLSWWSSQAELEDRPEPAPTGTEPEEGTCWIVYISGIGAVSGQSPKPEQPLLQRVRDRLGDDARLVEGVYPYSVLNYGLTEGRDGSWLWRQLERLQDRRFPVVPQLINAYNALQVLVSADRRYGPIFNLGLARAVWSQLREAGYRLGSGDPVVLLGWSGGGQICVGLAWYLADLKIPVYMLSLGGVMSSDPGLDRIQHVWHIEGTRDHVPQVGQVIFPSRWPIFPDSAWNRARAEGRITTHEIGPWRHASRPTYLSRRRQPNGIVPVDQSADALIEPLIGAGLIQRRLPFTDGREVPMAQPLPSGSEDAPKELEPGTDHAETPGSDRAE